MPYEGSYEASEAALLEDHGYDPDTHVIVGGWKESSWTAYKPKEYRRNTEDGDADEDLEAFTFTAKAFKFKVAKRPQGSSASDVEELVKALDARTPKQLLYNTAFGSGSSFIFAIGDTQLGKELDSPLEEVSKAFCMVVDRASASIPEGTEHVHIAWLGDCIEGDQSQGGSLRWRTRLTMTEQVRVLQRLMLYAVEAFAPLCNRLTVSSVPGNHDGANKRDLQTREDDSWAIQALVAVEDAIAFSRREDLKHVECYVPGVDQQGVTLDIADLRVAMVHGHQFRIGKEYDWWKGQTFGGQDEGTADLLLNGHQHHWTVDERGGRIRIGVPAMESESVWWKHRTGEDGNPGALLIAIDDGRVSNIERLYG